MVFGLARLPAGGIADTASLGIPGSAGYTTMTGSSGTPFAVGSPWGKSCMPVVLRVTAHMPTALYGQIEAVVQTARAHGVDVTVTTRSDYWDPMKLYPPGLTNRTVRFVTVDANTVAAPTFTGTRPLHINFGYTAATTPKGEHAHFTTLVATYYLKHLPTPASYRLATRQLVAFTQGVGSTTEVSSGIARGSTTDRFAAADLRAMRTMSGCKGIGPIP